MKLTLFPRNTPYPYYKEEHVLRLCHIRKSCICHFGRVSQVADYLLSLRRPYVKTDSDAGRRMLLTIIIVALAESDIERKKIQWKCQRRTKKRN